LLDADLSRYELGRYWGEGRFEEQIECEGIYLYTPFGNKIVLGVIKKPRDEQRPTSKYRFFWVINYTGSRCTIDDIVTGNGYKSSALKRINTHLTYKQITDLKLLADVFRVDRSVLIREAIDRHIQNLKARAKSEDRYFT